MNDDADKEDAKSQNQNQNQSNLDTNKTNAASESVIETRQLTSYQKDYLRLTLVLAISLALFSLLIDSHFDPTALLYIGIPTALAALVATIEKPKSLIKASIKGLTIFLLLTVIIFREGFICIIMAAPILYPITALAAWIIQSIIKRNNKETGNNNYLQASPFLIILIFMSLEGTHPYLTFERTQSVTQHQIVSASVADVKKALAATTSFNAEQSWATMIFPKPVNSTGGGINIGDTKRIDFLYFKHIFFNPHKGSTLYKVTQSKPQSITYRIPEDSSYIAHYLKWNFSKVSWEKIDENHTRISWQLSYDRNLDPAWYFSPLQQFFVEKTAGYLIQNLAETIKTQKNITH